MYFKLRQVFVTYLSLVVMVLQGINTTYAPYRAIGLISKIYTTVANPTMILGAGIGASAITLTSLRANAASLEVPDHKCKPGYSKVAGKCAKQDTPVRIRKICPNGFYDDQVEEQSLGIIVDTCRYDHKKTAEVVCSPGWVAGGINNQQCRQEKDPDRYGLCEQGYTKSNGKCVTSWQFESISSYVCAPVCNIDLENPLDTCPTENDPIELAKEGNKTICTEDGQAEGLCTEGEVVYLDFPHQQWVLKQPVSAPTSANPIMCTRTEYAAQKRECPTPNEINQSGRQPGEPLWGTPTGLDADNPMYYDANTGNVTHCLRTWYEDIQVSCPNGTVYDEVLNGCIDEKAMDCPDGTTYENGQCIGGDGKQCATSHYYDEASAMCVPKLTDPLDFDEQYRSGADLGWAIGSLQAGKTQRANKNGDVTLDMGLLNQEANAQLQSKKAEFQDVVAIGENDRKHNSYADISNTYGDEKEQTKVIQSNHRDYESYLRDPNAEHPNLAAEAYALVDENIHNNRPPAIDPTEDWFDNSKNTIKGVGSGTDPYFGDCEENGTKLVLNPDKQVITEETCTKPVTKNFSSCNVQRHIEEPVLKVIEGADKVEVEIIAEDKLRLTLGKICNNCLNDQGTPCYTYSENVIIQMTKELNVKKATFVSGIYDDMIVVSADGNEVFRAAKAPWDKSGWPTGGQSCENGTSYTWNTPIDATQQFQSALQDDNRIDFNYKIGVGGWGEAHAVVEIQFDDKITTDWFDEPVYEPENCFERYERGECTATGWECDYTMPPQTLGMENWVEWDGVRNWNITNNGYDARSTQNGPYSVYGSMNNVGNIWFKGSVTTPTDDDDSFGFIIGYPKEPYFNKDPNDPNYDPKATDQEYNHYYALLWTGDHQGSNGGYYGLSLYKSYVPYSTLEARFAGHWGINFHNDMFENDVFNNRVKTVDVIKSERTAWIPGKKYDFEFKQDEFGYVKFWVNDVLKIDISSEDEHIKTGRFGFATISLGNVFFEGMEKVIPQEFGPLFPGDSDPSKCLQGHATDFRCGIYSDNSSILGPNGSVWSFTDVRDMENTCAPLESREDCTWVGRECVEGFEQPDGTCLAEMDRYQCIDNSNAWEEVPSENSCDFLPCSDGSCVHRGEETNSDFAEVVTQVALISEMREYMDCSDPEDINTCQVYKGKTRECSFDQFGLIDCCEEFKGKTIDLFALTLNLMTVASFENEMLGIEESLMSQAWGTMEGWVPTIDLGINEQDGITQELKQLGTDIGDEVASAWEGVTKGISERFAEPQESAAGEKSSAEKVNSKDGVDTDKVFMDWATEMLKDEIIDEMTAQAINVIVDMLPEMMQQAMAEAGKALFSQTVTSKLPSEAAKQAAGAAFEMLASFMTAVSVAMAVMQIALMVYQLLNGCDDSEMDMPQVLKEKKCFYAYKKGCKKRFGICQNKNQHRYCCFSSIMSRLIMEQAIDQPDPFGGRTFTNKAWYDNQNCRGLTLKEVPLVDFSLIDLDEWYKLMVQSGTLPDGQETLEEWTKDNSYANPYGRSDSLQLQYDRGVKGFADEYRLKMDQQDVLGEADCSLSPDVQGCKTGILSE